MPDVDRSPRSSLCLFSSSLMSSLTKYIQLVFTLALIVPAMSLTHWLYVSIHSPPYQFSEASAEAACPPVACFFISQSVLVVIFHDDHPPLYPWLRMHRATPLQDMISSLLYPVFSITITLSVSIFLVCYSYYTSVVQHHRRRDSVSTDDDTAYLTLRIKPSDTVYFSWM